MAARKARIDSAAAAGRVMQAASTAILPPAHVPLAVTDLPFWKSVVAEFAKSEWTDHQLEVAAQLAKAMADLETERTKLRQEGYVLDLAGKAVANPRHGIARDLANSCMSLRRNLSLHARAQGGEARDVSKRRGKAKGLEAASIALDEDDLIARPTVQ